MKLERTAGFAIAAALFAVGCASTQPTAMPSKPQVASAQLMAAEITDSDNAPHVGKSQHSIASKDANAVDGADDKDSPRRDERKHNGGGFSGWK